MKVCTDACLFGACISHHTSNYKKALDIGTGTGLLSLMFAQKNNDGSIDAIEIDKDAYEQAIDNIELTEWRNKIRVYLDDIKTFHPSYKYDIIFSNPPFFINDLKSNDSQRNIAMHSSLLSYAELIENVVRLLDSSGVFYVLIPFLNENIFIKTANEKLLYVNKIVRVKQTPNHYYFRSIISFSTNETKISEEEIIIKETEDNYSRAFINLLSDYYLYL